MWPDRVSNPGPPTYESGALPITGLTAHRNNYRDSDIRLKFCTSKTTSLKLILYDSPLTKSVKTFVRDMEYFYLRPQSPSEESLISLSGSGENMIYVIQSL